ncbi:hypothetical protein QEZ52_13330 [Aliisedimentitalea scapharcae]|uniref:Uncharacterized protein n=1 Tax=Aliisedimentitalea scapharcae TaxID=1524259 RepID=A0ABZ2XNE0_9RHOB
MSDEILATMKASAPRRIMGVGMLGSVGSAVLYVALSSPPEPEWLVFLLVVGVGALWSAVRMWQATEHSIELTHTQLRCSDGTLIAEIEDIDGIDRGFFAFKPSHGFLVRTRSSNGRVWQPGLWWRMGRRIGVGGVTPGAQGKAMAEILAAILYQKENGPLPR